MSTAIAAGSSTTSSDAVDHERIASLALSTYLSLPPRGAKPGIKSNGRLEWTVLAAFALSWPRDGSHQQREYSLISLATGLRCLPYASLPLYGDVLHDQHAEILARRAARLWLLHRLEHELASPTAPSDALFEPHIDGLWRLKQHVRCHLYVSTLPCGAASNRLLEFQRAAQDAAVQKPDAASPGELLDATLSQTSSDSGIELAASRSVGVDVMRGRAGSTQHDALRSASTASLRTKPGRPDAPPSICMSCTDKLSLWSTPGVGIQGALLSALVAPIHITSITIADHPLRHIFPHEPTRVDQLRRVLADDCRRAIGRTSPGRQGGSDIDVGWASAMFPDSKEAKLDLVRAGDEPESCVNSIVHVRPVAEGGAGKTENLASGTRMGAPTKRKGAQPLKATARSALCRLNYFVAVVAVLHKVGRSLPDELRYADAKEGGLGHGTSAYRGAKDAVLGPRQASQQVVESFLARASRATAVSTTPALAATDLVVASDAAPFHAWLRNPTSLAQFDLDGNRTDT